MATLLDVQTAMVAAQMLADKLHAGQVRAPRARAELDAAIRETGKLAGTLVYLRYAVRQRDAS